MDGHIHYSHLDMTMVGDEHTEPTSIDLDYDVVDTEDVVEAVAGAFVGADFVGEPVEELVEVPIDLLTDLEVALPVVDLLDFVRSLHIVVDRYPMDEVVEDHHSFLSPDCVLTLPIAPRQLDTHYPTPKRDYKRQWHLVFDYCTLRIMCQG